MNGMEMMTERVVKSIINNLPPGVSENIGQIFQKVVSFEERQIRIERKLDILLSLAGYQEPDQPKEITHVQPEHEFSGTGNGAGNSG